VIETDGLIERARTRGARLSARLGELARRTPALGGALLGTDGRR
jgi:4-aminobutyrate aminotransferase-like enzyme